MESPNGKVMGYVYGKVEGLGPKYPWHGHVTAVTVAPEFRRLGLARALMGLLERVSDKTHHAYFVDLFVRLRLSCLRFISPYVSPLLSICICI